MKNNKNYKEIMFDLWKEKKWISNADFAAKTGGSPKFTSRISDMRRQGYNIIDQWVDNKSEGRHKEYAHIKE